MYDLAPVNARSFLCCGKVCGKLLNKIVDNIVFVVHNRGIIKERK